MDIDDLPTVTQHNQEVTQTNPEVTQKLQKEQDVPEIIGFNKKYMLPEGYLRTAIIVLHL